MSDEKTPENDALEPAATPETPVPAAEPAAAAAAPAPASPVPAVVAPERKKRGVGIWAFILGLLTVLGDAGYLAALVASIVNAVGSIGSGDPQIGTTLVIGFAGPVVYFGGFLVAGLGALLGLIAAIANRGRVLGILGLLLAAFGLLVRVLIATGAINVVQSFSDGLGNVSGLGG